MKKYLFALASVLALVAGPTTAARAARIEADPNKEYPISPEAGAYVICVKAYTGADAHVLANQLVLHLRQNGWPAYIFDYSAEEERKAKEWLDDRYRNIPPEARPHSTIHVQKQCGVLIGGYKDFDGASSDIPKVKKTPEPPPDKRFLNVDFVDQDTKQLYQLHTYAQCIATRNPTVRAPKPDAAAPDPAWKQLNDGRPYSLLKCGKPWTLAVLQFQGVAVVQPRSATSEFLDKLGLGGRSDDMLEASAKQAEEVAKLFGKMGIPAYVLHTRSSSIVTVGAYDRSDDDQLRIWAEKLKGKPIGATGIRLFDEPRPMQVPKL